MLRLPTTSMRCNGTHTQNNGQQSISGGARWNRRTKLAQNSTIFNWIQSLCRTIHMLQFIRVPPRSQHALTFVKRTAFYTPDSCWPACSQCSTDACRPKSSLCWTARRRWPGTWPMPCTRSHYNRRRHHKLPGKHSIRLRWRHVDSHRCTRIDSVRCKCH